MNAYIRKRTLWFVAVSLVYLLFSSTPCLAEEVTIFTPRKTAISAYRCIEMAPDAIERRDQAYAKIIRDNRWSAVIKSGSSCQYNGHGYAWQVYAGGAAVKIEDKDVSKFWMDGSYQPIKRQDAGRGDIVVMTDPQKPDQFHSAIVLDARWCMSKWADGPLVLHKLNEHPFGRHYRYYRRVKVAAPSGLAIVPSH